MYSLMLLGANCLSLVSLGALLNLGPIRFFTLSGKSELMSGANTAELAERIYRPDGRSDVLQNVNELNIKSLLLMFSSKKEPIGDPILEKKFLSLLYLPVDYCFSNFWRKLEKEIPNASTAFGHLYVGTFGSVGVCGYSVRLRSE